LVPTLESLDNEEEITDFVCCKIKSLLVQNVNPYQPDSIQGIESKEFRINSRKFHKIFDMPEEEKLVNCKYLLTLFYSHYY